MLNSNRVLVLYTSGDIIIFVVTKEQNLVYKMKFKPFDNPIKKLNYVEDRDYFICLDYNGKIFYFNNPETALNNLTNKSNTDDILKVNHINIDIVITNLFYVKNYILFFDQIDKLYYMKFRDLVPEINIEKIIKDDMMKNIDNENVHSLNENEAQNSIESTNNNSKIPENLIEFKKEDSETSITGLSQKKTKINIYSLGKNYSTPAKFANSELDSSQ